jgi:hypothetical protein
MSAYDNEQEADATVIATLVGEINRLRSLVMSDQKQIIVSDEGIVYEVSHARVLTLEEVQSRKTDAEEQVRVFNKAEAAAKGNHHRYRWRSCK